MGRPPVPTAMKLLRGTYRADRANPNEPKPEVGAHPPPWLPRGGPARVAWNRLARELTATRVLTEADGDALALGCMALADYLAATADPSGWRRADAAWKRYASVLRDFGMTPSSRVRVSAVPAPVRDLLAEWEASGTTPPPPVRPRKPAPPPADPLAAWLEGDDA
jgi:phage terminase small subunit